MADVKTGVSTKRMLDQHYTPLAHSPQFVWSLYWDGVTPQMSRVRRRA